MIQRMLHAELLITHASVAIIDHVHTKAWHFITSSKYGHMVGSDL